MITPRDIQALLTYDELKLFNFSVILLPADLRAIANAQNDMRSKYKEVAKAKLALEHQVTQLTQSLNQYLYK
jgi:hypothetical protein